MRILGLLIVLVGCTTGEWSREYRGYVPGTHRDQSTVILVIDKRTGKPIKGAYIRQHQEWSLGRDGRWAPMLAEGRTDEFGLVTFELPESPGPCHWTVHAPGYAPTEEYGGRIQPVVELEPGYEKAGQLVDHLGRPLPNVEVEYKVGCAHAPALRTTHTDEDGVFVFKNVLSGDITFEDPRFAADYWGGGPFARPRRWGIDRYQVLPGATLRGRVVGADGTPPRWAALFSDTSSRGPCALVDSDGAFAIRGVHPGAKLFVFLEDAVHTVDTEEYRPGGPILIELGDEAASTDNEVLVGVSLVEANGSEPDSLSHINLDRDHDGRRFHVEWSPYQDGPSKLYVSPGRYVLSVGDAWSTYVSDSQVVEVTESLTTTVTVRRQPRLDLNLPELEGDPIDTVWVLLPDEYERLTRTQLKHPFHLPAHGDAWVRVDLGGESYTFPIGPEEDGQRPVDVRLPGLKRLGFPELGGDYYVHLMYGEEAAVELPGIDDSDDSPYLATYAVGKFWLVVWHEQKGRALTKVDLPWQASGPIEIRGLEFQPHPKPHELRVVGPDNRPVQGAEVDVVDDPSPPRYDWSNWDGSDPTDENGVFRHPYLRDGTHIRVDVMEEGWIRTWFRLEGEPPYVVRLGSATIELDLRGYPKAAAVLDGHGWLRPGEDGMLVLRGLRSGPHHLVIAADGYKAVAYRLLLEHGEIRRMNPGLEVVSGSPPP